MRDDLFKVIVERPRWGSRARGRNRAIDLGDEASARESAAQRHRDRFKSLSDNLAPLRRWLEAQVDRPWNKVHAELCGHIDKRNTVQQHVLDHVEDFVALRVVAVDGALHYDWHGGQRRPLDAYWAPRLYVDPEHGLLRRNRGRDRARAQWERGFRERKHTNAAHRRVVSDTLQLLRLDGVWYAVDVEPIPPTPAKGTHRPNPPFDVIRHCTAWRCPATQDERGLRSNRELFGQPHLYAAAKRQLSRATLRQHGLHNDNA